jgi:two-component system, cell cycle response regulator
MAFAVAHEETTQVIDLSAHVAPRVLIVDDDPLVAEHLEALVRKAGFEVEIVHSGAGALAALRRQFAPVVISDRNMPDIDGLTLCRTIRSEQYDGYVYVILLTMQDAEADILSGLEAGADDYLSKRTSGAQLVARLRTAQRILSLERSLRVALEDKTRLATTDALTGSNNRRYLVRHLNREIRAAWRAAAPLCVLLLDIDHFKRVNDAHGHAAGDDVLKGFARRIRDTLPRETDWFARLGGEEFAVVLPQTDLTGAAVVAERLRQAVAAEPMTTCAGALSVTVSLGVSGLAALVTGETASVDALLDSADRRLYRSKEDGRNRVTTAPVAPAT